MWAKCGYSSTVAIHSWAYASQIPNCSLSALGVGASIILFVCYYGILCGGIANGWDEHGAGGHWDLQRLGWDEDGVSRIIHLISLFFWTMCLLSADCVSVFAPVSHHGSAPGSSWGLSFPGIFVLTLPYLQTLATPWIMCLYIGV